MKVIRVGVSVHIGTFYFIEYLMKFNEKYPNVKINILNKKSDEMLKMLSKRELDIVIDTDMLSIDDKSIKISEILKLESCFVANKKFKRLSEKGTIDANELIKYPLILPSVSTNNRKMIDINFKKKNIILNPLIEANSSSISKEIIDRGLGIGWMIKEFVKDELENKNLFEIKVNVDQVLTSLSIAYHEKYVSDIVKKFIKIFTEKTNSKK